MSDQNYDVYSAMQVGKPFGRYKKTILGKVYVEVLNPFDGRPEGLILHGNPKKNQEGCFVDTWTQKEDVFLKRRNKSHFDRGILQVWKEPKQTKDEKLYSEYSDEDVVEIIMSPFLKLRSVLNQTESEAFVQRILKKARELERSDKIIHAIEARLSEIQGTA